MTPETFIAHIRDSLSREKNDRVLLGKIDKLGTTSDTKLYSNLLRFFAHLKFSSSDAKKYWKKFFSTSKKQMGRSPGLMVAILDFFIILTINLKLQR
ncbi:MAG: hypothetical protein ACE5FU_03565 [Nitrospinota bacterium]